MLDQDYDVYPDVGFRRWLYIWFLELHLGIWISAYIGSITIISYWVFCVQYWLLFCFVLQVSQESKQVTVLISRIALQRYKPLYRKVLPCPHPRQCLTYTELHKRGGSPVLQGQHRSPQSLDHPHPNPPAHTHMYTHRVQDKGVPLLRAAHHCLSLCTEQRPFIVGANRGILPRLKPESSLVAPHTRSIPSLALLPWRSAEWLLISSGFYILK